MVTPVFRSLLLLLAVLPVAPATRANDLLRLYELALSRDSILQSASARADAAVEVRPQAIAQLLPQVATDASRSRDTSSYQVQVSQAVWNFESFSRLKEANREAQSAQARLEGERQSLMLRTAEAYFGILAARDQLATARSERSAFATLLEQAQNREATGVGPRSAVEQVQSFYDATEARVIDSEDALEVATIAMAQIVGEPAGDVASLRDEIPLASPAPASVEQWVENARRDNPDVRASRLAVEAADLAISAQLGKGLPTLSLVSTSSHVSPASAVGGGGSVDTVGLAFSYPLFQGGAVASGMRQSRALYRQAQADYETAVRDTESQARTAYRGVVSGIQRIGAAQRAVDSARAAVEASRNNVEFGTGTEFDLLNAQNNYSAALRIFSQSRYDYLHSMLALKRQSGRLSEGDLIAIDSLLVGPAP